MHATTRTVATLLATALTGLLFLAYAPAAIADNWASSTDPLVVSDDGTTRGHAYGTSYKKDSYLKNHTYYRDRRDNGNAVYTETQYRYYMNCTSVDTAPSWCGTVGKDQSARSSSSSWVDQYDADDYGFRNADRGRVYSKVCEDQDWSGDPCSRTVYVTFTL